MSAQHLGHDGANDKRRYQAAEQDRVTGLDDGGNHGAECEDQRGYQFEHGKHY
ncbi:MAG: hypothetical protein JOZ12_09875 [Sinobacteraceae bacterium]|nr:hypothetical protein [Nevskiaceae bacterium]MBV9914810.1 hypothetical protein [Nevskiaceae bacterium]